MRADRFLWHVAAAALLAAPVTGAAAASAAFSPRENPASEGRIHWVPAPVAQVKLDGKTPLKWNVLWPEKTDKRKGPSMVLVLLGRRYIALDIKGRLAYSVLPTDLQAQGNNFDSADLAVPAREIPSTDWAVRDVGPAELIHLTLGDYGRELEVQLPHPPDLRWAY
jgi:hypothetical protein